MGRKKTLDDVTFIISLQNLIITQDNSRDGQILEII